MKRLFASDSEISRLVQTFTARDHVCWARMVLWRLPRVWRYYREQRFYATKPWLGAKWLFWVLI